MRKIGKILRASAVLAAAVVAAALCGAACFWGVAAGDAEIDAARDAERARLESAGTRRALDAVQAFLREADRMPVERFSALLGENGGVGTLLGEYASVAFSVGEAARGEGFWGEFFGGAGLGDEPRMDVSEKARLLSACLRFLDSRRNAAPEKLWRTRFKASLDELRRVESHAAGTLPSGDPPPMVVVARRLRGEPDLPAERFARQPRLGVWAAGGNALPVEEKFSGGFAFALFRGEIFLVREIRAPGLASCGQGALLDAARLFGRFEAELRESAPGTRIAFAPGDAAARELAGLPVTVTAETLPGDEARERERRANRVFFGGVFLGLALAVAAGAGTILLQKRAARERRLLLDAVAHELRTPLASLASGADSLALSAEKPETLAKIRFLRARIDRFGTLLDDLIFSASRARAACGGRCVPAAPFGEIAAPIFENLSELAARAGMDFSADVPPDAARAPVRVSPLELERIFSNLAGNASRCARADGAETLLSVSAGVSADGKTLEIRVADDGGGIAPEARERLFEAFSGGADGRRLGLGIGLALSRKIARAQGGDLRLEKSDAAGTVFLLTLRIER
ncbi:MAG: sensor histidine kinase [Candidatus Spyradosoma sp.]